MAASVEQEQEVDSLGFLEERIQKTVALVNRLRSEKDAALKDLAETRKALDETQTEALRLTEELDNMREDRQQVRSRIEKLLGHIDQLGNA